MTYFLLIIRWIHRTIQCSQEMMCVLLDTIVLKDHLILHHVLLAHSR